VAGYGRHSILIVTRRVVAEACGTLGLALAAIFLVGTFSCGPRMSMIQLATAPVVRLPLDTLRRTGEGSLVFTVPNSREIQGLRRAWGEPRYLIFAYETKSGTRWIHAFQPLHIRTRASVRQTLVPTAPASDPPYSYSSDTTDFGVTFPAPPGEQFRLDIHAEASAALPDGELVVQPQWPGPQKDRIVAAMLEESMRPYLSGAGIVGLSLLVVGFWLRRNSPG
jgi:hypothetical protein